MKPITLIKAGALAAAFGIWIPAQGIPWSLSPGDFAAIDNSATYPGGGVLVASLDSGPVQDQPDLRFTARLRSEVYSGVPANALGGLTFVYQLINVDDPLTEGRPLQGLGIPFDPPATRVDVDQTSGFGNDAYIAGLTGSGDDLGFVLITEPIDIGESSEWLVVYTDSTGFKEGLARVAGPTVEDVAALVPAAGIPNTGLPDSGTTLGLLGLAVAGLAGIQSSRRGSSAATVRN